MKAEPDFDHKMNTFAGRLSNIVLLGFFSLLCSLPIVSIGASLTALYEAMDAYLYHEQDKALRVFFRVFKEKFLLSTLVFALHMLAIGVFVWDLAYYRTGSATIDYIGQAVSFSLLVLLCFEMNLVFVVIGKGMENKALASIKRALDMAFTCFRESCFMLIISVSVILAVLFIFRPFLLVFPGVICFLHEQILPSLLERYRFKDHHRNYIKENRK